MSEVRKIQIQDGKGNVYHPQTVSEQVLDLDKRLEGLAKETYVDEKIAEIPEVDLSDIKNNISTLEENKADKTELESLKETVDKKADKADMDSKLSLKADKAELNKKADKSELTPINREIDNLKSSGVESKRIMVEALNSKGVQASINNSIRENANKINDISVGDYSIGDICKRVEEVWDRGNPLDSPEEEWSFNKHENTVTSVSVDSDGNVYSGSLDKTVKKISPKGHEIWNINDYDDGVNSITVDIDGNVYTGGFDKTVRKISPTGQEIWRHNVYESVYGVSTDSAYNAYAACGDGTVRKISPNGSQVWRFIGFPDVVNSVSVDEEGNVYAGSFPSLKKLSSKGEEIWSNDEYGSVKSIVENGNKELIAGGTRGVIKITPEGDEIWTRPGFVNSVSTDEEGNVYSGSDDETVRKISPTGSDVWEYVSKIGRVMSVAASPVEFVHIGTRDKIVRKLRVGPAPTLIGYKILE